GTAPASPSSYGAQGSADGALRRSASQPAWLLGGTLSSLPGRAMVPRMSHDQDAVGGMACSRLYGEGHLCLALHTSVASVRGFSLHRLCPGGCTTDPSDPQAAQNGSSCI